ERGKYPNVVEKINYLNELGINAIELMPVKESPGDYSWGYCPVHYFAADSSYGTTAQLKEMIDELHGAGIRVIVDGVYNHANTDSPLAQMDHDYWFRHEPRDKKYNWGPEFHYDYFDEKLGFSPARKFVHDSLKFWILKYQIDGVRYDAAIQIADFDVMHEFVEITREMSPMKPFLNIAEYLPPDPQLVAPQGPMDSCWNDNFMHIVTDYLTSEIFNLEELKNAIDCRRFGFQDAASVVNYIANHDHNRLFLMLGEKGFFGDEAHCRARLGALLLLTAVGIPMIWMGEEFGEYKEKTTESNKINWSLLENPLNKTLFEHYKTLINLRKTNPAFQTANLEFFHEDADSGVLCFQRFDDRGNVAAVAVNFSNQNLENYAIKNFPEGENWHEWTKNYETQTNDNSMTVSLPRREGLIFIKQ
ncbi:MAG: alpha-amylase family glycosyl hydrolase, partial [Pyrinomonadaceae bacterium]